MKVTAIALVALMMMLGSGCRTQRQLEQATLIKSDSLVVKETFKIDTLIIPEARAEVVFGPQTTDHRPQFLDYKPWTVDRGQSTAPQIIAYDKQGPATITVYRESNGALRAIATCDSINRLLISTMSEQYRSGTTDKQLVREKIVYRLPPYFTLIAIIAGVAVVLMIVIKVKNILL